MTKQTNEKTYEYLFGYFSDKILSGELKLNDKLPAERDIAEELGVSRNSVREVMHMLEITGLTECRQGSGNYVKCDPTDYMMTSANMVMSLLNIDYTEIFDVRVSYEMTALKLAIEVADKNEVDELGQIVDAMKKTKDCKEAVKLDIAFHHKLIESSHNRLIILYSSMINKLMDRFIANFRTLIMEDGKMTEVLNDCHVQVYEAIVNKDFNKAVEALGYHFDIVEEKLRTIAKVGE